MEQSLRGYVGAEKGSRPEGRGVREEETGKTLS